MARTAACLRARPHPAGSIHAVIQAASMTMPRRAAAARASDRCVHTLHGGPAGGAAGTQLLLHGA
jgi:hypothetical protein